MYATIIMTTCLLAARVHAYKLNCFDCTQPKHLQKLDLQLLCTNTKPPEESVERHQVVQALEDYHHEGYRCSVTRSEWTFHCGAWSHLKLTKVPQLLKNVPISRGWCEQMVTRQKFRPSEYTGSFAVKVGTSTTIPITLKGSLQEVDDRTVCQGETVHHGEKISSNIVILESYTVKLAKEKYVTRGSIVEALDSHVKLRCAYSTGGCQTSDTTYIWTKERSSCQLESIRTINTRRRGTFIINDKFNILLNLTSRTTIPGCVGDFMATQYPNLFTRKEDLQLPLIEPGFIRPQLNLEITADYMMMHQEEKLSSLSDSVTEQLCQANHHRSREGQFSLGGNHFAIQRGEVLYSYLCTKTTTTIRETPECYRDVPVDLNNGFVQPISRIWMNHSALVECENQFPTTIHTEDAGWVEVDRHTRKVSPPAPRRLEHNQVNHHSMAISGIYTQSEMISFSRLTEFPNYQAALLNQIALGSCLHQGQCQDLSSSPIHEYDLDKLLASTINKVEALNLWSELDEFIRAKGDYLALTVLSLVLVHTLINILLILHTAYFNGPEQAVTLWMAIYFGNLLKYQRLRRRRNHLRDEEEIDRMEMRAPKPLAPPKTSLHILNDD